MNVLFANFGLSHCYPFPEEKAEITPNLTYHVCTDSVYVAGNFLQHNRHVAIEIATF